MDRLTYFNDEYGCWSYHGASGDAAKRLAAYEDAEDEERLIVFESAEKRKHIQELAGAEADGRLVALPCKVGDTVYVISYCENVLMNCDDDYETGTGAMECPFESDCPLEDCDDENRRVNRRVFETTCSGFFFDSNKKDVFFDHINAEFYISDFGKTVFLTREEAEAALARKDEIT